jgi:phosphoribosyl-AMP cyclohydrolase / phosphoribosyl-ATP pyrophosphohydrolase
MTDRTLRSPGDLDSLDFDKLDGLLPVVAQDANSGEVLMVAFADREALEATLSTGEAHFWSRSRKARWKKGETSGNTLSIVSLHADCDADTVLALVTPAGPSCHTGESTCFGEGASPQGTLERLDATLASRAIDRPSSSYTTRLLDDTNLRLKKLGEESAELVAALATKDGGRATEEAADLLYHILVGLRAEGIGADAILSELDRRAS